jgi:hypothetical protein
MTLDLKGLPGHELVEQGLTDLRENRVTPQALLIAIAAPNLRRLGFALPAPEHLPDEPGLALYRELCRERRADPYGEYNALIRRLVSFERALERENASAIRREAANHVSERST